MTRVRNRLAALTCTPLSDDTPGIPCWSCGLTANCADCAGRRRQIDDHAGQPPRGPGEIRENTRRSWSRMQA